MDEWNPAESVKLPPLVGEAAAAGGLAIPMRGGEAHQLLSAAERVERRASATTCRLLSPSASLSSLDRTAKTME